MKVNKTLIGAVIGAAAGAYIATHKKQIQDKVKGAAKTISDAGMAKLKGKTAAIKVQISPSKKAVAKKAPKAAIKAVR